MADHDGSATDIRRIANAVDERRLWDRHGQLAAFGAREDGGVNRQALSREDGMARLLLKAWSNEAGYSCSVDAIGNMFVRREGSDPSLPPILCGSHLDTQPAGGRFDGASGVLAAMEALHALDAADVRTLRPIEVVSWTNEEGSRFAPGIMGSSVFAGNSELRSLTGIIDANGISLGDALSDVMKMIHGTPSRDLGFKVASYLELHIEQGPVLEKAGATIGIVTGIQGTKWYEVEVSGAEAHAGTTPSAMRRDALRTAVSIVAALQERYEDEHDVLRFTVGRMVVEPNSPNTVPSRVVFSVDIRHPEVTALKRAGEVLLEVCSQNAGACEVEVRETVDMEPVTFDAELVDMIENSAAMLDLPRKKLISGAFHDAKSLHSVAPSAMLFIPCAGGLSHNPRESAKSGDIAAGARVLAVALARLARR